MVREKSGKSQGILLYSNCGHPDTVPYIFGYKMGFLPPKQSEYHGLLTRWI